MKKTNRPIETSVIDTFRRRLRVLERAMVTQLEADTSCCGISLAQCHTLLELAKSELSLTSLAAALDLDTSTLSRTVDGLVRAGLVVRAEDPLDRRLLRLTLTPAGRAKVENIDGVCNRYYGNLLTGLNRQDRSCVIRAVELLAERMHSLRRSEICTLKERRHGKKQV